MKQTLRTITIYCFILVVTLGVVFSPLQTHAASQASTKEAQTVMKKFTLYTGLLDGVDGPMTKRGLCMFRFMSKLPVNRNALDSNTLTKLREFNKKYSSLSKIPAPYTSGYKEYLYALETCQMMMYSVQTSSTTKKHMVRRIIPITTGIASKPTPNGTYKVSATSKGWRCSGLYPESCKNNYGIGRFGKLKTQSQYAAGYGNMYNFRMFKAGGWGIHGSTAIRTYPASAGCIRVSITDSDWMYDHVGDTGSMRLKVAGAY